MNTELSTDIIIQFSGAQIWLAYIWSPIQLFAQPPTTLQPSSLKRNCCLMGWLRSALMENGFPASASTWRWLCVQSQSHESKELKKFYSQILFRKTIPRYLLFSSVGRVSWLCLSTFTSAWAAVLWISPCAVLLKFFHPVHFKSPFCSETSLF